MPLSKKKLAKEFIRAALEFHSLRPWERFGNQDLVALDIPETEPPAMASIMGAAGEEFGISVYLGEDVVEKLIPAFEDRVSVRESVDDQHYLAFSVCPYGDIPPYSRKILDLGGYQGRREAPAPWVLAKEPGRQVRNPNRDELQVLLYATRGLTLALEAECVSPVRFEVGAEIPRLVLTGDARAPEFRVEVCAVPVPREEELPPPAEIPPEVRALPRRDSIWRAGLPVIPAAIRGDDRTIRCVLVLDDDLVAVCGRMVQDVADAPREFFRGILKPVRGAAEPHLPREVRFRSRSLHRALASSLTELGVESRFDDDLPEFDEMMDELVERFGGGPGLPAPDDLEGWKRADYDFTSRAVSLLGSEVLRNERTLGQYFGDGKRAARLIPERLETGMGPAYLDWLLTFHRPAPGAPRTGDTLLGSGRLAPAERVLLRNRMRGRLSVYRVKGFQPEGRVLLVDVLDGSEHEARDFSFAENESARDACVPLLLFRAGDYQFLSLHGPALTDDRIDEGLDLLERLTGPLTPEALAQKPAALGRLWLWSDRIAAQPPPVLRFVNVEKHRFSSREADFETANPDVVLGRLLRREEFAADGPELTWVRRIEGGGIPTSGPVVRARIRRQPGGLLARTNSVERMAELRDLLESMPGVRSGEERDVTPEEYRKHGVGRGPVREIVLDEFQGRAETEEEAARDTAEYLRAYYLDWIEQEQDALGGRSPRQVCDTEEGRRRMRRRILSMACPDVVAKAGMDLPRNEMLERLGLPPALGPSESGAHRLSASREPPVQSRATSNGIAGRTPTK